MIQFFLKKKKQKKKTKQKNKKLKQQYGGGRSWKKMFHTLYGSSLDGKVGKMIGDFFCVVCNI